MRHRWSTHVNFLADFVSYALANNLWSLQIALARHAREL